LNSKRVHSVELRRERDFDRRQKVRRKELASYLLFRNDPVETAVPLTLFLLFVLVSSWMAGRR
jgi:hypothetical protein